MLELFARPPVMILLSALAYASATIAMKLTSQSGSALLILLIALCLITAVGAEIIALRQMNLGLAYIAILGLETVAVLTVAWAMGDGLTQPQMAGGGFILLGTFLLATNA